MKVVGDVELTVRKNFDALIKLRGLKRGEVERAIGVSAGYFCRTKFGVNLTVAYALTRYLNISLDDICSKDFYKKILVQQLEKEKTEIEKKIAEIEQEKE